MKNPEINQLCMVRRPICDRQQDVIAYELVLGSSEPGQADFSDEVSSETLISSLVDIGLTELAGNKPVFIPLSKGYITGVLPLPDTWPQLGFEIRDKIVPDQQLQAALEDLSSKKKYIICLSQVHDIENRHAIIELADYVKINVATLSFTELQAQIAALSALNVKLIVTGVSMPEMFDACKNFDIQGFIGYYFCMPRKTQHQVIPAARMTVLKIISELQNTEKSAEALTHVIEKDVSFSYRILRFMNSAYYGAQKPVNTLKRAVILAGLQNIKTWATILAHSRLDDKPHELMITSLVRAKMCEILSPHFHVQAEPAFMTGLFSTLDALLDCQMDKILHHLSLSDDINNALLDYPYLQQQDHTLSEDNTLPMTKLLATVVAYEKADWVSLSRILFNEHDPEQQPLNNSVLKQAYIKALAWAGDISAGLLTTQASSNVVKLRR